MSEGMEESARQILDAFVYAIENDRAQGRKRIRNAYSAGDISALPGWESGARLPGWYDQEAGTWYEDRYQVGSNVGNTLMGVSVNPNSGKVRLMMVTWDTFIEYEGYDVPQLIDMPYRNNGPEETVKVFDANFDTHVDRFMSLNFLNL